MASVGMQMLASALCLLGWAGVIISCLFPMWRVTAFVGSTIITSQIIWEGIWMSCVAESTGQIMCKPYESLLALSADLQAARALTVFAIATGGAGLVLAFIGGKCTRFLDGEGNGAKGKVAVTAGALLIATGLLCLIPTSWAAVSVVQNFYSNTVDAQRREIGASLYIGCGASVLLILGGALFIISARPLNANSTGRSASVRYLVVPSKASIHRSRAPTATTTQGIRTAPPGSLSSSTKPPLYTRPLWEDGPEQDPRLGSERSWAPSTDIKKPESTKSEYSEAPSTKSQLKRAELQEVLSVATENEDESSRTYI